MGMKKEIAMAGMMGLAMAMIDQPDMYDITERDTTPKPKPKPIKKPVPFSKQDGVLRMIEDYNLIKKGKSKKGIIKQTRIKNKINKWLADGLLTEEDLTASS
jgi:hypothetical protein